MDGPLALIVEDDYDVSIIFAKALREAGFETEIVRSGKTALAWLASATPDLVVLDLHLPKVAGTQVLDYIRRDPRLKEINVIVATAYPHMAESLHDVAEWVFFKPVGFNQLRDLALRFGSAPSPGQPGGGATSPEER